MSLRRGAQSAQQAWGVARSPSVHRARLTDEAGDAVRQIREVVHGERSRGDEARSTAVGPVCASGTPMSTLGSPRRRSLFALVLSER